MGGGGGGQNVSISCVKSSCLSHGEGSSCQRLHVSRKGKSFVGSSHSRDVKKVMQIIYCNVKPHYQESRLSLRYQIFPLLMQEGLCKV